MSKKKRRQMKIILTLSVMIAAVPLTLSLFCDAGEDLPVSVNYFNERPAETNTSGKILPMLANK